MGKGISKLSIAAQAGLGTALLTFGAVFFIGPAVAEEAVESKRLLELSQPPKLLRKDMNGENAIRALGSRLGDVAALAGLTTEQLVSALREDPSLWVHRWGHLFYVDPIQEETDEDLVSPQAKSLSLPAPLGQTFELNSKPGSNRTIYLDFDGYSLPEGTSWNQGNAAEALGFSLDEDYGSFNDAERAYIQEVWLGVSEAFSAFDVNVTTQEPDEASITRTSMLDMVYGTRVVIAPQLDSTPVFNTFRAGGVANVGVFNLSGGLGAQHRRSQPAWVFYARPRPADGFPGSNARGIASTIAHEVGHNLGLRHDGHLDDGAYYGGHGGARSSGPRWSPIMGSGAGLGHWSRGEYPRFSNTQQESTPGGQDDYLVMDNFGVATAADDFPASLLAASPLTGTSSGGVVSVEQHGVIETRTDVDYFQFVAGGGPVSFTIVPAAVNPMLDLRAVLFNNAGTQQLAVSDDPATQSATLNINVAPGTYRLAVEGTGIPVQGTGVRTGNTIDAVGYSDYGSIGQYRITGSFADADSAAPIAVATADKVSGTAPLVVSFSADGSTDPDGTIQSFRWTFGNGQSVANSFAPTHTYTQPGNYTATLTVTDNAGLTGNATILIQVFGAAGPDTTPDPFSFQSIGNVQPEVVQQSAPVTITGIDAPTPVSVSSGGEYSINGGPYTATPGTISNGDSLRLRRQLPPTASTTTTTSVTVGTRTVNWSVTTSANDVTPDGFTFPEVTGARWSDQLTSAPITITGINTATPIAITTNNGGAYSINGGPFTSAQGQVPPGATLVVRHTTAGSGNTVVSTQVQLGGPQLRVNGFFRSTTAASNIIPVITDTQPDSFTFGGASTFLLNRLITSPPVKLTGFTTLAPISISADSEYCIGPDLTCGPNGLGWTSANGTVLVGSNVRVRLFSGAVSGDNRTAQLTVGGVTGSFTITTR